ncbi:MAG: NADPH:quinone oxidoreductase family protein [Sporichthyaceae bacterium]
MKAMRVETFGEPLVLVELPQPTPAPGEVVIDVAVAGVNFPDLLVVDGTYQILPALPFSPGKEVAGVVSAVGADVAGIAVGQRVLAQIEYGGYREAVAVPASNVVVLPDGVSFAQAAACGLGYLTAHFALVRRAHLRAGETVLVTGAGGGVGSGAVGLAKAMGAVVIAVAQDDARAALALEQGADHVVRSDAADLRDQIRALTDGRGVDVVVETVGGAVFAASLSATAWEGRVVVIGFASGEIPTVKAGHVLVKNIAVLGLQVSDYRDREPESVRLALGEILDLIAEGRLDVPIAAVYPLEKAGDALAAVRAGTAIGKVVLEIAR